MTILFFFQRCRNMKLTLQGNDSSCGLCQQYAEHITLTNYGLNKLQLMMTRFTQFFQLIKSFLKLTLKLRNSETNNSCFQWHTEQGIPRWHNLYILSQSFSVHLLHLWMLSTTEVFEQNYRKTGLWVCDFVDDKEVGLFHEKQNRDNSIHVNNFKQQSVA